VLHLKLVVPGDLVPSVLEVLESTTGVVDIVRLEGVVTRPSGDLIEADVAREAGHVVLTHLRDLGLSERGSIAVLTIDTMVSTTADRAERDAPGAPSDAVVWDIVEAQAVDEARSSWTFYVFLTLATMIAAIAVVLDSPILVIGAMVVSPDFSPVASACVGIVRRKADLVWRALRLLVLGFAVAISITTLFALLGRAVGWITAADVRAARPATDFIWTPDRWSFIVALLAGAVGVLALTTTRSSAMVGVFISVTTVPAAGALAVALATGVGEEIKGSATQLVVNVAGMLLSGTLTLLVLQVVWVRVGARRKARERSGIGSRGSESGRSLSGR